MVTRRKNIGFTLIELVVAVAILSVAFMSLLFLRTSAVDRAASYNRDRMIQRLARQKLDEVAHGIVEDLEGDFEEDNRPEWTYEVRVQNLSQDGADLLECTITVFYSESHDLEPSEYTLSKWFFPDEESALLDLVGGSNTGENR
jgi:prepilin-type N-terminal cleavage/methylation domain-containing protein